MKKGERYYSNTLGLIEIVDARRRTSGDNGYPYMLVRDKWGETKKQRLGHRLIALDDNQWTAIDRLSSTHWSLHQYVIDQFRQGYGPGKVGNDLQSVVDQLLCNKGTRS